MTPESHTTSPSFLKSRLARKQLFYILVFSSIITLIGTLVQLLYEYRSERQYMETQLSQIQTSHLPSLTNSLWALDDRQMAIQLNNILSLRDIVYLEIRDDSGVIASAGTQQSTGTVSRSYSMVYQKDGTATDIGTLTAQASKEGVYQRMVRRIFVILVTQGLKTFFVSLFILFIIHRKVIQYLIKLSRYAQGMRSDRLQSKPDLDRSVSNPPDELDQLTGAINSMRHRLLQDISIQKKNAEALQRYEHIISSSTDLMSFVDHNYIYLAVNDAYLAAHAKKREDIVGVSVERLMGKEKFEQIAKGNLDRALNGDTVQYQSWFDYAGIGRRFMDVKYHPHVGRRGTINGVVVCVHDLTERMEAEQGMSFLFDQSLVMLFIWDMEKKRMVRVNKEALRVTGRSEEELLAIRLIDIVHPDDRTYSLKAMARLADGAPLVAHHTRHVTAGGEIRVFEWNAVSDPERQRIYAMAKDITERKKAEEEREKLQTQLNQARKLESIGQLAGGVAHDFNNMLSIITGHAEMMIEDLDPHHPMATRLNEIRNAAERSADFTRQLLAFARKQTIAPIVLNLNETIEGMRSMLERLIGEDIDLTWIPGAELWSVKLDPSQIDQILANLCVNARDSISGVGKITIETANITLDEAYCKSHGEFQPGEYVMLTVSDSGCGIDKENFDKVFEPFFTTKNIGQGTGLGLSTVYGIVKQNDGLINVYSEPGKGTTFKIYLRRYGEEITPSNDGRKAVTTATGGETILVVEDEASILTMTRMMLERLGYTPLCANRPSEAVKIAESHTEAIHLLITDVVMPEMSGRDLADRLGNMYPNLKILYMSGYPANVIVHHGVLDNGVLFIDKPFTHQALSAKVRQALDGACVTTSP